MWGLVGAVVLLTPAFESELFPQYTFGMASFLIGGVLLALPTWRALHPLQTISPNILIIPSLAMLFIVGAWLGWAGPGAVAESLDRAAAAAVSEGDLARAIVLARRATFFAPFTPTGFLFLANLELKQNATTGSAIVSAERALRAPYLSSWNEHFEALAIASTARLTRREPSDWAVGGDHLALARDMWRRNARLNQRSAILIYYNSAIVACHDGEVLLALTHVLTALLIDSGKTAETAQEVMKDSDLQCLSISDVTKPKRSTLDFFRSGHHESAEQAVHEALTHGIAQEEVIRALRLWIRKLSGEPSP
jgi:hypothetical protein